jgi:hypothetical protein
MERKMLLGIKQRAEHLASARTTQPARVRGAAGADASR